MTFKIIKKFTAVTCAGLLLCSVGLAACSGDDETVSQYTITVDYNDGSSRPATIFVDEGDDIEEPDAAREGYQVDYWSTDEEGKNEVTFPYTPTGDTTLYAQWQAAVYTVTFDFGVEDAENYEVSVEYNKTVDAPSEDKYPENEGFTLYNWMTAKENGTVVSFPYTVTGDTTFYADWVSDEQGLFTVTIDLNQEELENTYDPITVAGGDKITSAQLPNLRTAYDGYIFNGWSLTADAAENDIIEFPFTPEGDVTLYANWTQRELSVRYSYNDFTHDDDEYFLTQKVMGREYASEPEAVPEREGFTFIGWYDAYAGGTKVEFPAMITATTTYYAYWRADAVETDIFDAEYTAFNPNEKFPGYSGASNGAQIIRPDEKGVFNATCEGKPNGYYVSYLFKKGATLTLNIHSDKAVDNVVLYASLGLEFMDNVTFSSDENSPYCYQFIVNGKVVDYSLTISGLPNVGESGVYSSALKEYRIGNISLKEGDNVIQLVTNNTTPVGGTSEAMAPSVDYIRLDGYGDATLSWNPELDSLNRKLANKS